ncbi:MAG: FAD-dependent oxidoreductase [Aestuariivita sp.]|nr:FAD-dependent oxidoreductase [Aestuariivita sp.]
MYDVTVRGAGIFGLSIAWICLQRGASVRIVDPNGPGSGASGGYVGALAPHVPENWNIKKSLQFQSLIQSESFWQAIDDASGLSSGYTRTGRIQPIADNHSLRLAHKRSHLANDHWKGKAVWQIVETEDIPCLRIRSETGYFVHDTLSARVHPKDACRSLVGAIQNKGGQIETEAKDQGAIVWATGVAGLHALSAAVGCSVGRAVKGQAVLLQPTVALSPDLPQIFTDGIHIVPHANGTIAVGSTSENEFVDADAIDDQLDNVLARAQLTVPLLNDTAVIGRWAGLRPKAQSRAPILGRWPDCSKHFIANGGFKIGYGLAPIVADMMADLVLENVNRIPNEFSIEASIDKAFRTRENA